jgi:hypothetical protein
VHELLVHVRELGADPCLASEDGGDEMSLDSKGYEGNAEL